MKRAGAYSVARSARRACVCAAYLVLTCCSNAAWGACAPPCVTQLPVSRGTLACGTQKPGG